MKIFFARHGETTGDVEDRYGGDYDDHLTDAGRAQSVLLAEQLRDKGIEALFVSPLIRARETADIISEHIQTPVFTVADFKERNRYGILSGMTKSDAREKYPEMAELVKVQANTIEGAEQYNDFAARVLESFAGLANDTKYSTFAIISHGGPLDVIVREVVKYGEVKSKDHCAWLELHKEGGAYKLVHANGITFVE